MGYTVALQCTLTRQKRALCKLNSSVGRRRARRRLLSAFHIQDVFNVFDESVRMRRCPRKMANKSACGEILRMTHVNTIARLR